MTKTSEEVKKIQQYIFGIRKEYRELKAAKYIARSVYDAELNRITTDINELQKRCPHVQTQRHPDASGNNDSWDECLDCGKDL